VDVTRVKRLPLDLVPVLVVLLGLGLALGGLYMLTGLAVTMIVAGVVLVVGGLVVDVG
jgi:hypothetical protein